MNLLPNRTALLVIDVQRALFEPPPFEADAVIVRINALASRARAAGVPVIFVQHEDEGDLLADTSGWELEPHLATTPSDLRVRKRTCDSFHGTPLHALLAERDVRHLLVCGYASEFCVDTTVRSAARRATRSRWPPMRTPRTTSRTARASGSARTTRRRCATSTASA